MTTDQSPSMAAYHRTLSNHIANLLQTANPVKPTPARPSPLCNSTKPDSSNSISKSSSADSSEPNKTNSAPPPLVGTSSRSTDTTTIPTPPELVARPEDHIRAWKEAGREIFSLPSNFNLSLDHRRRSTTNEEDSCKEGKRVKGLGIDLAMSHQQHTALKMGLMVDPIIESQNLTVPKPINIKHLMPKPSQESLRSFGATTGVSPNPASTSSVQLSEYVGRQHRRRSGESSNRQTTSKTRRDLVESAPLRDIKDDDKEEEYEARRQLRLKRKQGELVARINLWRDNVQLIHVEVPEIEPTPPTPSIASGMFRLTPLVLSPSSTVPPPLPVASAPAPAQSTQFRPTSLPPKGITSVPPPTDLNVRLRALDAFLGDMSLVPHRRLGSSARSGSPSASLRIVADRPPPPQSQQHSYNIEVMSGMPTPRPHASDTFKTLA